MIVVSIFYKIRTNFEEESYHKNNKTLTDISESAVAAVVVYIGALWTTEGPLKYK